MGRLIKYELKKQQTSRNIILALLLVFLLAVVTGIFTDNGNLVGISVGMEIFVGMFVFFYMGIESLLIGVIEFIDGDNTLISKTKKKESVLYYPMEEFAGIFFPAAKAVTEQIVNGDFD